jgi:hypothetical protein
MYSVPRTVLYVGQQGGPWAGPTSVKKPLFGARACSAGATGVVNNRGKQAEEQEGE